MIWVTVTFDLNAEEVDIHKNAGTTGAAFLKIEAGSRPAGLGGAFVGLADDVNAVFYNPAGLTSIKDRELTAMQNFWFADINNESLGYAQRMGNGVFGLSLLGAFAEIEERSEPTRDPDRTFTAYAFSVGLSYSYELARGASLGGTLKVISQEFDVEDWIGVAGDVGVLLGSRRVRLGASIRNLGTLRSKTETETITEPLPMSIRAGGAIHLLVSESAIQPEPMVSSRESETAPSAGEDVKLVEPVVEPNITPVLVPVLTFVTDVNIPLTDDLQISDYTTVHFGLESWFYERLALRAGYSFGKGEYPNQGFIVGVGFRAWGTAPLENINFQFDYAYAPDSDVGDTHRISFISRF